MTVADEEIIERIHRRTLQLLQTAVPLCRSHRAPLPDPLLKFDLRGQAAGQAVWRRIGRPVLRFNLDIARRHPTDFVERTVTHEVAHLLTAACHGRTRPHGAEWRAVMAYLGVPDPSRCHDYSLDEAKVRRQRRWAYVCACSRHLLSTTLHKRILTNQARYHCRRCGARLHQPPPDSD
jgi:SprT protein